MKPAGTGGGSAVPPVAWAPFAVCADGAAAAELPAACGCAALDGVPEACPATPRAAASAADVWVCTGDPASTTTAHVVTSCVIVIRPDLEPHHDLGHGRRHDRLPALGRRLDQ